MTNLNDIIEQAAQDRFPKEWDVDSDIVKRRKEFKAGLERATTSPDILREILRPFLEWVDTNYCNHGVAIDKWSGRKLKQWLKEKNISGAELIEKYIQHLQTNKDKEDGK